MKSFKMKLFGVSIAPLQPNLLEIYFSNIVLLDLETFQALFQQQGVMGPTPYLKNPKGL